MSKRIKPLANPQYTQVPNYALDRIMPHVSANAWRVLCVIIRATWGWTDEGSPTKRREDWQLSYATIKRRSGIGSYTTIKKAIDELLEPPGYILRKSAPLPAHAGSREPSYLYSLNRELQVEVATTETVAAEPPQKMERATTETVESKRNPERKQTEKESICAAAPQAQAILNDDSETDREDDWEYNGPPPCSPAWYEVRQREEAERRDRRRSRPRQRRLPVRAGVSL